jgi:anaphase-promoting complex subunit 2
LLPLLGTVDLAPAVKALNMWADKGVLVEEAEASYRLLEVAEANARAPIHRARECFVASDVFSERLIPCREATGDEPMSIITVQQQQAEQMKIHWKVPGTSSHSILVAYCRLVFHLVH